MKEKAKCCKVDAVVSVDSKGQIVLPKDIREKAKLEANERLAVVCCEQNGEVCCIVMIKAEKLGDAVNKMLGPVFKEIFK
ncbi:MAG: HgcAB-associated protein [Candidatus Bathyarchaeia archaeon]